MKTDVFGHLSQCGRYRAFLEEAERVRAHEFEGPIAEKKELFGLGNWGILAKWAEDQALTDMRAGENVAVIDIDYHRRGAIIYFDRERVFDPRYDHELIVEHELAHILINPSHRGCFMNENLEHVQVIHIGRACQMLRCQPEAFRVDPTDMHRTISQAYTLCRLDENNWQLRFDTRTPLRVNGRRVGAYAESLFHENHIGFAVLSACQIDFYHDPEWAERAEMADHILEALWRVVLNPYGPPSLDNVTEATLARIMNVMKNYGWNEREK